MEDGQGTSVCLIMFNSSRTVYWSHTNSIEPVCVCPGAVASTWWWVGWLVSCWRSGRGRECNNITHIILVCERQEKETRRLRLIDSNLPRSASLNPSSNAVVDIQRRMPAERHRLTWPLLTWKCTPNSWSWSISVPRNGAALLNKNPVEWRNIRGLFKSFT